MYRDRSRGGGRVRCVPNISGPRPGAHGSPKETRAPRPDEPTCRGRAPDPCPTLPLPHLHVSPDFQFSVGKSLVPQEGFEPPTPSLRITYLAFQYASPAFRVFPS